MTINLTRRKMTFQYFLAAVVHFQVVGLRLQGRTEAAGDI